MEKVPKLKPSSPAKTDVTARQRHFAHVRVNVGEKTDEAVSMFLRLKFENDFPGDTPADGQNEYDTLFCCRFFRYGEVEKSITV